MATVRMGLDPELGKLGFIGAAPVKLVTRFADGRTFSGERDLAVGNPERPMSAADHKAKFLSCAGRIIDARVAVTAYEGLQRIEQADDVPSVLAKLRRSA